MEAGTDRAAPRDRREAIRLAVRVGRLKVQTASVRKMHDDGNSDDETLAAAEQRLAEAKAALAAIDPDAEILKDPPSVAELEPPDVREPATRVKAREQVLIWHIQRAAWWSPEGNGHTKDITEAGLFDLDSDDVLRARRGDASIVVATTQVAPLAVLAGNVRRPARLAAVASKGGAA